MDLHFGKVKPLRVRYYSLARLGDRCSVLLSTLAWAGQREEGAAGVAFEAGRKHMSAPKMKLLPLGKCGLDPLGRALGTLATVKSSLKKEVLQGCYACVAADRQVTVNEAELMRAIADSLEVPMPPLLPGNAVFQ